jgi:hypothetical protein
MHLLVGEPGAGSLLGRRGVLIQRILHTLSSVPAAQFKQAYTQQNEKGEVLWLRYSSRRGQDLSFAVR